MQKKTLLIATVCTLTLLISGCGVRYPKYYTLSIAPALKEDVSSAPRPVTVAVRRFETPAYLRQGRIVYSQTPGEIGFYEYRRWAVDPGAAVTTAMVESLRELPATYPFTLATNATETCGTDPSKTLHASTSLTAMCVTPTLIA